MHIRLGMFGSILALSLMSNSVAWGNVAQPSGVQIAFVRNGNLWVKNNDKEQQLTHGNTVFLPQLSFDGQWLSYIVTKDRSRPTEDPALHVRNLRTGRDVIVAWTRNSYDFQTSWAPNKNILAFQTGSLLNEIDMNNLREQGFKNVSLGVERFSWLPDGNGFLVSSQSNLKPDGWTNARLYKVTPGSGHSLGSARPFYTLPKEVTIDGIKILVIGTSTFKWSSDGKWIAFIVHPTASGSMDSDVLSVLSTDTKQFTPVAEMLNRDDWFKWAPGTEKLAFINGGGRIITHNKRLAISTAPRFSVQENFTPIGLVDNAFTWNDDGSLTLSRAVAGEYQETLPPEQLPALFNLDIAHNTVRQISAPPKGVGDYQPKWQSELHRLSWVRADNKSASLWVGDKLGTTTHMWINNIDRDPWSLYFEMWNKLFDVR